MNEYFAESLIHSLEEASTVIGNRLILEHLSKNGVVTLEEAEFYHGLTSDVITESAEDFIPDAINVPDEMMEESEETEFTENEIMAIELVQESGEELTEANLEEALDAILEAEENAALEAEHFEESTDYSEAEHFEESTSVASRILAGLK